MPTEESNIITERQELVGAGADQGLVGYARQVRGADGAAELKDKLGVPIEGPHEADLFLLERLTDTARSYGIAGARNVTPDRWLAEGDQITIGGASFDVLHCPGHSPGSVVFVNQAQRIAVVGDVLFRGSVGRTDLPGADQ